MPLHMPRSPRRRTSTRPPSSRTITLDAYTVVRTAGALGGGMSPTRPVSNATHDARSGHASHDGLEGVHTIAPSSIIPSLNAPGSTLASTSFCARSHAHLTVSRESCAPSRPSTRISTRVTFPSTSASRRANTIDAIDPAVYRPTPGRSRSSPASPGTSPACFSTIALAHACSRRARW